MKNEKFSVVIPSYNTKNYLKKAIDSVLNQTYQPFEIIIIDNNSIDGSQDYIKSLKIKELSFLKLKISDLLQNQEILASKNQVVIGYRF